MSSRVDFVDVPAGFEQLLQHPVRKVLVAGPERFHHEGRTDHRVGVVNLDLWYFFGRYYLDPRSRWRRL